MDSYDLFGEDVGGSMLDGLADLGADNFDPAPPPVSAASRDGPATGTAYVQSYGHQMSSLQQESPLQKLATFGGDFAASNHIDSSSQNVFHQNQSGYDGTRPMCPPNAIGAYQSHVRTITPQHENRRPPHPQVPTTNQYGSYCPPDNMYSMEQQQGLSDAGIQGWSNAPGYPGAIRHYGQVSQAGYRQHLNYAHQQDSQQKIGQQQYSTNQQNIINSMMQSIPTPGYPMSQQQQRMQSTLTQQQCYPQSSQSMVYPGSSVPASISQSYSGYNPLHHQQSARMPHLIQYPQGQQLDMNTPQSQPPQQPPQQQQQPPQQQPPPTYNHMQPTSQMPHHGVPNYNQQHQVPRPIGIEVSGGTTGSQYTSGSQKQHGQPMGGVSPQYRAPFPQLSPQMSPRPQVSPRPAQQQQQMSPRPVMSPAKPSTLSPHPHSQSTLSPRPATSLTPKSSTSSPAPLPVPSFQQQSTLQQLEQMVIPSSGNSTDYPSYQPRTPIVSPQQSNPLSPAVGPRMPVSPQQWPHQSSRSVTVNGGMGMPDPQAGQSVTPYVPHTAESRIMEPLKPSVSSVGVTQDITIPSLTNSTSVASASDATPGSALSQSDYGVGAQLGENYVSGDRGRNLNSNREDGNLNSHIPPTLKSGPQTPPSLDNPPNSSTVDSPSKNISVMNTLPNTSSVIIPQQTLGSTQPSFPEYNSSGGGVVYPNSTMDNIMQYNPGLDSVPPVPDQSSEGLLVSYGPPGISALFSPMSHPQEMAALQQQLQEIYCMPPAPDHQEKIARFQERLSILQQHTATEQCTGGPHCILQDHGMYGPPMLGDPLAQVSSSTAKGRSKTRNPNRKSRKKQVQIPPPMLPPPPFDSMNLNIPNVEGMVVVPNDVGMCSMPKISVPSVNAITSISSATANVNSLSTGGSIASDVFPVTSVVPAVNFNSGTGVCNDRSEQESGTFDDSLDDLKVTVSPDVKPKKPKPPRKPREPKKQKEPKPPKEPKAPKEPKQPKEPKVPKVPKEAKKKKEPKSPGEPKTPTKPRKKPAKKKKDENASEGTEPQPDATTEDPHMVDTSAAVETDGELGLENEVLDASQAVDTGNEEATEDREEPGSPSKSSSEVSTKASPTPKKSSSKKKPKVKAVFPGKKLSKGTICSSKKKKKLGNGEQSDAEDITATPPPSPDDDSETAKNKRRSARNTHRKKYVDDIMLSISDEDSPKSTPKNEFSKTSEDSVDPAVKPNFVYINTTDEDSMVVQYILAVRKGRREVKVGSILIKADDVESLEKPVEVLEFQNIKSENGDNEVSVVETAVENDRPEVNNESPEVNNESPEDPAKIETVVPVVKYDSECSEVSRNENTSDSKVLAVSGSSCSVIGPPSVFKEKSKDMSTIKPDVQYVEVEEYFVKYRNFSYLHCEWKTEEELFKGDKRISAKLKRFKQKMAHHANIFENLEDEPYNPDYVEVDRVLDVAEHTDPNTGKTIKHYLVKWRSMQYEDSTWELEEDVDPVKIQQFEVFSTKLPKEKWKKKKPIPDQWVKLEESPDYKNSNKLRPYQLEGLNWLLFSWYNGRNCILADEMGLGKTIQSIAFINAVFEYGIRGPFLVIAPLSTIPNWQREFEAWTDMNVIVYHGSSASRNMLQEYEIYHRNEKGQPIKDMPKFNVLITTFEIIITDCMELKEFHWRLCVIDEAHRLKNRNCKLLEGLRLLNLEHRVLLSGTPLQNNVNELFSLLNFLEPTQFSSSDAFLQEFGALKTETEVQKLQLILKPMMLRRLKEDVEKSIAPKEETVVEVELTNIQKKYYRGILEKNFSFLSKGTTSANVPNLMNTMMELRKCCIHPYLLNGAEEQIQYDYRQTKQLSPDDPDGYYQALIHSSGKMVLIDKLLPKLKGGGHRVLIFSQMVRCLDILEDYLVYRKYPFERIDGRIRGNLRQAAIDRFSKPDSDRFVFLLCTKAGGLGINLTAADTVIIYDSDWNPQNDLQAQARCHRIGQQKMVKVYRLLCRNTYEREMFDKASLKLGLDKALLQSMNTAQGKDTNNKQLSKKEIEDLLKKGAYGAIMEEDSAGDKFCEEDIDQILERRTQVITLESEKGSTFSKASFASSGIRSDIDIDDPDFWKKWAKKAEIEAVDDGNKNELVISEPRRRTQIKRYGHDESVVDMSELDSSSDSDEDPSIGVGRGRGRRSKNKLGRKTRLKFWSDGYVPKEGEIVYGSWARSECFKVERGLLTFGWGRWIEILAHSNFRRGWRENDVEDCARVILLYCLRYYRGDEKIRSFIWDLITPSENGECKIARNHMGLTTPVPRGGRRSKKQMKRELRESRAFAQYHSEHADPSDWSRQEKYDGDIFLENNYKKHLSRHANKVLLRVRMLYYIKHEIMGDLVQHIADGVHVSNDDDMSKMTEDDETMGDVDSPAIKESHSMELGTDVQSVPTPEQTESASSSVEQHTLFPKDDDRILMDDDPNRAHWPSMVDLNTRLRRVIAGYQRNFKKEEMKLAQKAKQGVEAEQHAVIRDVLNTQGWDLQQLAMYLWKIERREKIEQIVRERERQRIEVNQRKWSRREEADFYRTVSIFGVQYDRAKGRFDWTKFRTISRLDRKFDDTMTEYYKAFYAMCKKTCGLKLAIDEECIDQPVEPISEEKARKCLERIELLNKIREEILPHPYLDERLQLCLTSPDVPEWWVSGKHDKDLLRGVAKHGLGRTDFFILNDPELSFVDVLRKHLNLDQQGTFKKESFKEEEEIKFERPEDILKSGKNEIIVKLEKGEGTLKIEKIGVKKETVDNEKSSFEIEGLVNKAVKDVSLVPCVKEEPVRSQKNVTDGDTCADFSLKKILDNLPLNTENPEDTNQVVEDQSEDDIPLAAHISGIAAKDVKLEESLTESMQSFMHADDEAKDTNCNGFQVSPIISSECNQYQLESDTFENAVPSECAVATGSIEANERKDFVHKGKGREEESENNKLQGDTILDINETEISERTNIKNFSDDSKDNNGCDVQVTVDASLFSAEKRKVKCESEVFSEKDSCSLDSVPSVRSKGGGCSSQAAELKAKFPDLEVIQPLSQLADINTFVVGTKATCEPVDYSEPTVAQLLAQSYQNPIKWPKDYAIQTRLQNIIHVVEHNEWPTVHLPNVVNSGSVTGIGTELDLGCNDNPDTTPKRDTSTPLSVSEGSEVITITTDHGTSKLPPAKKRKRHIAIDVETERAKLHALLNNSNSTGTQQPIPLMKPSPLHWETNEESLSEESRRSTPVAPVTPQPPPAHQQCPRVLAIPFDKYHLPSKTMGPTMIPGTSSILTPIDLSSGLPKMNTPDIPKTSKEFMDEVQDFSMPSKNKQKSSKLDDMLGKLMKKNNCPAEEPVVGKEKKRRKLDEIVLGLSAAKEQKSLSDTKKSTPNITSISPSVTVTPTSLNSVLGSSAATTPSKPFTITVTSVPSPALPSSSRSSLGVFPSLPTPKESFSSLLAHAEQQNLLLKKQQQLPQLAQSQRKTYESMIADLSKVADISSKINSYSHEAKVNKWLAEQTSLIPEQPLVSDYLSAPRRRRPRVDPSLLDWKKLTGEENVSVINRLTGKKITGTKAPQLKRLAQWLLENPMFDVDPKWADLVKERGNLPHDLQKRLPPGERKKGPGRPPLLASPPGQQPSVSQANIATSMASTLPFPSLASAGLSGLSAAGLNPTSLLSGLSLGGFDPKNNPLLLPFGGMPNMSALGSMSGLGNLGNMSLTNSLFANLAGLGIPSLTGIDTGDVGSTSANSSGKGKSRKSSESDRGHSSSKPPPVSSALPFFFPNPSLLYTPLGLGSLNPFSMQPGAMSSAYDSLAQQCGLLNGNLSVSNTSTASSQSAPSRSSGHKSQNSPRASTVTSSVALSSSANHRHQRAATREALDRQQQQQLQQLLLPHDTHLLESLSRASSLETAMRNEKRVRETAEVARGEKRARDMERKEAAENLNRNSVVDFTCRLDERPVKKIRSEVDRKDFVESLSRSFIPEIPSRGDDWLAKSVREAEMKEALESLCRTSAEILARTSEEKIVKHTREVAMKEALEGLARNAVEVSRSEERDYKTLKVAEQEVVMDQSNRAEETCLVIASPSRVPAPNIETAVDVETLLQSSTVSKCGNPEAAAAPDNPVPEVSSVENLPVEMAHSEEQNLSVVCDKPKEGESCTSEETGESSGSRQTRSSSGGRRSRGNKRPKQTPVSNPEECSDPLVERKVLRSSAGRAAAAAAARAAAAAKEAAVHKELEQSDNTKDNSNKTVVNSEPANEINFDKDTDVSEKSEA